MVFDKHIFICINHRDHNSPKKFCGQKGQEIRLRFVKELKKYDLKNKVRANKSGCLSTCSFGPVVVIYPAGIWYYGVTPEDVPEIVKVSILGDDIVSKLHFSKRNILS